MAAKSKIDLQTDIDTVLATNTSGAIRATHHRQVARDATDSHHNLVDVPFTSLHGRGTTAAKPAAAAGNTGWLYFDTDLGKLQRSNGAAWEDVAEVGSGPPSAHAATHAAVGSDPVTLAQSQITNLTTDLAAKVATTRQVATAKSLTGGGDLTADRTLELVNAWHEAKQAAEATERADKLRLVRAQQDAILAQLKTAEANWNSLTASDRLQATRQVIRLACSIAARLETIRPLEPDDPL